MTVESWITPEETPALAEAATVAIEARLSRFSEAERAAFWASIRKCYNTPYNDPARKPKARIAITVSPAGRDDVPALPVAAMAAMSAEAQAA